MAALPASVQIGPYVYRVLLVETPIGDSWAYVGWERREIQIKAALSDEFQRVALWHEVLHGINDLVAKGTGKRHEEAYVKSQAPLMVDTLRRNPELVAFLLADAA